MQVVLILDETARGRAYVERLVNASGCEVRVIAVDGIEAASRALKREQVDLFIVDVPVFDIARCRLLESVPRISPMTQVLVTSIAEDAVVAGHVWRLGVRDYLLKPYHDEWLVASVRTLLDQSRDQGQYRFDWERNRHLALIDEGVHAFEFKKCIDSAREYLDLVYDGRENPNRMRDEALAFADGIAELASPLGPAVKQELAGYMKRAMRSIDFGSYSWDVQDFFERLLDRIFGFMDRAEAVHATDIQRVLTYVDRNVRRGSMSMAEAARYANMSPSYFSKFFKRETGKNFIAYLTDLKIEYAKLMLERTDFSMARIASELSYRDSNYFGKAFKKKTGITPVEYRGRARG